MSHIVYSCFLTSQFQKFRLWFFLLNLNWIKKIISIFIFVSLNYSCATPKDVNFFSGDEINENFQKKFGNKIQAIKDDRSLNQPAEKQNIATDVNNFISPESQFDTGDNISNSFDYVDISYLGSPNPKQFFPSYETYQQGFLNNPDQQLSPKIFEISYNTFVNPPFNNLGEEFDYINIPTVDAFGVRSSSANKNYTLVPIKSLETAISQINNSRSNEDIEFTKKIIAERKFLIRNKKLNKYQEKNQFVRYYDSASSQNYKDNSVAMNNKTTDKSNN